MREDLPFTRDLVLIGGGHAHALVLRKWGMDPLPGVRVTVIDPGPTAAYSGMLPGHVAGHYRRDELDIDLVRLCRFAGARLVLGPAQGIDRHARRIAVPGRPAIGYDACSLDIGITSDMPQLPGFAEHAVPAKPLGPFATRWAAFREGAARPRAAVIGGGVAGAELAMAMAYALRGRAPELRLIDRGRALDEFPARARAKLMEGLAENGVEVLEHAPAVRVGADHVELACGRRVPSDFTVGAAGARPYPWLRQTGLDLHDGFVRVGATLQSSDPRVFAVGDCAHLGHAPRPKAGAYAVRAAPVLFDNLRAALMERPPRRWRPQRDYLKLVSLGRKAATAEKFGIAVKGPWLWRWKDRIDRRFMDRLRALPAMGAPEAPREAAAGLREELGAAPFCAGCGAKVGRGALGRALAGLPAGRADVESRPGDDAAVLRIGEARQVVTTDHLRAVTPDPVLMTRIAAVHALGDVWAMGAAPQAATATVILPRMSAALQERTLGEIMETAAAVFGAAGADIVGGHSSMGSEMTLGFTVTGLCRGAPVTLAGARPGDALILTKPLGSGVVMAAEMRGLARGDDVAACWALMVEGQGPAAAALADARAMTDVTGFGLAGHLTGLCEASGVAAEVELAAVPLMPGALDLAGRGVRSTLFGANRLAVPGTGQGPRADLMFDPQTAGGLLAAVPDGEAALARLRGAGVAAARIGRIVEGPPGVRFL